MRRWIGLSVVAIGALHTIVGGILFAKVLSPVLGMNMINAFGRGQPDDRNAAFWFFFCGFLILIVGGLLDHAERLGGPLPAFLPWSLIALTVVGAALMPGSGFWLLLVPAAGVFVQRRSATTARTTPRTFET